MSIALLLVYCYSSDASMLPTFSIKTVICPQLCKGERLYRVVFVAAGGVVSTSRGVVQNDTIVGIDPLTDYRFTVTVTSESGEQFINTIELPVCDPIIPSAPLTMSVSICEGEKIPELKAFGATNVEIDWYQTATGGIPVAFNTSTFVPKQTGTYYAQARIPASGCVSFSRTPASLTIQRTICPVVSVKIIR